MDEKKEKPKKTERKEESLVRIMSTDIPGNKNIHTGLTRIKGISWSISNAVCKKLNIDKKRKISSLSKEEVEKISEFMKDPKFPVFLKNRKKDFDSGNNLHLTTTNLELRKEFDIKRLKKIRSYRGIRHMSGLPSRGQRTKSNFRKNKALGVKKKGKK